MADRTQVLDSADLQAVHQLIRALRRGEGLTPAQVVELTATWEPKLQPDTKERAETYALVGPDGTPTGVLAPRWLCHLLGLRHLAVEIALSTESGLILLQTRSRLKDHWPNTLDMAVAGHVPVMPDGRTPPLEAAAWKEMEEEIGLKECDAAQTLKERRLTPIGEPYFSLDLLLDRNPPFVNAEARQIFAATLTGVGLAQLRFPDGEAEGLALVEPDTAWALLAQANIASGMRYSLPRFLDWLERQPAATG